MIWRVDIASDSAEDPEAGDVSGPEDENRGGSEFWGLAVGGKSVFVGAENGEIRELDLASGYAYVLLIS